MARTHREIKKLHRKREKRFKERHQPLQAAAVSEGRSKTRPRPKRASRSKKE